MASEVNPVNMSTASHQNGIEVRKDDHGQQPLTIQDFNEVTPEKWLDTFNNLNRVLATLQGEISSLQIFKGELQNFSQVWKEATDRGIKLLEEKVEYQDLQIRMLKIQQDETIKSIKDRQTAACEREMRPNLLIYGLIPKKNDETRDDLMSLVKDFFTETMQIEDEIPLQDVYRVGKASPKTVMIKLKYPNDKSLIYAHAKNLQGKENEKKKGYFVKDDSTEQQDEVRKIYRDLQKENEVQSEERKFKTIKINKGKVYINNSLVRKYVQPPTNGDILRYDQEQLSDIKSFKLFKGPEHTEKTLNSEVLYSKLNQLWTLKRHTAKFALSSVMLHIYYVDIGWITLLVHTAKKQLMMVIMVWVARSSKYSSRRKSNKLECF